MARLQDEITKSVKRFQYLDGIFEIQAGLPFVFGGGYYLVSFLTSAPIPYSVFSDAYRSEMQWRPIRLFIFVGLYAIVAIGSALIAPKLRERITHQRAGFVDFRLRKKDSRRKIVFALLLVQFILLLVVGLIVFIVIRYGPNAPVIKQIVDIITTFSHYANLVVFISLAIIIPLVFAILSYKVGIQRFYFLAALAAVLGFVLFIYFSLKWNFNNPTPYFALYFIGVGLAASLLGVITLRRYLRDYPAVKQEEE